MNNFIQIENYLSDNECQLLIDFFQKNTQSVSKTDVNLSFAGRIMNFQNIKNDDIKQIMRRINDDCADRLKTFFAEHSPIYPDTSQIVKWYPGQELGGHCDKCLLDGTPHHSYYRDYSAVIYLNEEYEGGEFYFLKQNDNEKWIKSITIKPKKGMLIGFTAGLDHPHGVNTIKNGLRYTMPIWFTKDKKRSLY